MRYLFDEWWCFHLRTKSKCCQRVLIETGRRCNLYYEIVARLCSEKNMSIYDLERKAQIGNGTIGKWKESGAQPSIATLEKIAKTLEISLVDLLPKK